MFISTRLAWLVFGLVVTILFAVSFLFGPAWVKVNRHTACVDDLARIRFKPYALPRHPSTQQRLRYAAYVNYNAQELLLEIESCDRASGLRSLSDSFITTVIYGGSFIYGPTESE
jgi:hypothetical protein